MGRKEYCVVSGILFSLVALAHLLRVILGISVRIDEFDLPMFVSWAGFVVPAGLAIWAFRVGRAESQSGT